MNKTKIIATVGPLTYKKEILEEFVNSGVDVIRLNMNYSNHDFAKGIIEKINEINAKLNTNVSVMLDLEGPCIRTGEFQGGFGLFQTGDRIRLYTKVGICNNYQFSVNYPRLMDDLKFRSVIKLMDGKVILEVVEKGLDYVVCEVINGGKVASHSKLYLPDVVLNRKFLTEQDRDDILFAHKMNVDYIGLSHVSDEEDIMEINDLLIELENDHIELIAKIQNERAVKSFDRIVDVSDGILLVRGDLSVELPLEEVPNVKNKVIKKCQEKGKISIITSEFDTFINNEVNPSRAEVSDLASIVSEGIDAVLLSGETAICDNPLASVREVERIINAAENTIDYKIFYENNLKRGSKNIVDSIGESAALSASSLKCKTIIVISNTGYTAKLISKLRPSCMIVVATPYQNVARSLNLYFGVLPVVVDDDDFDSINEKAISIVKENLGLKSGDKIIVTGGYPFKKVKHTNFMKIDEI